MKRVQRVRHSAAQAALFLGRQGEITINLTSLAAIVHDGIKTGGYELGRADASNIQIATSTQDGKMTSAQVTELATATSVNGTQQTSIDDHESRITANEAAITTNAGDIGTNAAAIATKQALVGGATENNIASWNGAGQTKDSGIAASLAAPLKAGTVMCFIQNAVPTGWTLSVAHNDKTIRFNSTGGVTGGSWSITGLTADAHTHTISSDGAHTHGRGAVDNNEFEEGAGTPNYRTDSAGTHSHGGATGNASVTGVTSDGSWRPLYVDAVIGSFDG